VFLRLPLGRAAPQGQSRPPGRPARKAGYTCATRRRRLIINSARMTQDLTEVILPKIKRIIDCRKAVGMKTVLLVEDDFDTLHPLSELLCLKGYQTVTASEGGLALSLARQHRPDLIVTDIALPGANGLQFIQNVRRDSDICGTPIIVISGCGSVIMLEAAGAGADICLDKPIDLDRLWQAFDIVFPPESLPKPPREESEPPIAAEIDHLVDKIRSSTSRDERDDYLKRLKAQILKIQQAKGGA
jgi:DNA-binding response OmpR family regulator